MAKPFNDEGGSGFHVHVSVNDDAGRNVFGDPDGADGLRPGPPPSAACWRTPGR